MDFLSGLPGRFLLPSILSALLLAGCGQAPQPATQPAAPTEPGRLVAVDAPGDLLDGPGGAPVARVEPGMPLAPGARRADSTGTVWIEVRTTDGRQGWLPESRLAAAGEEGHIATH